jgi:hypothetical protein
MLEPNENGVDRRLDDLRVVVLTPLIGSAAAPPRHVRSVAAPTRSPRVVRRRRGYGG